MFEFERDVKTIRIPVTFKKGQITLLDGQPLPKICEGSVGELLLDERAVEDAKLAKKLQAPATVPMLDAGQSVFFLLMANQIPLELWSDAEQKKNFVDGPEGPCVEVRLEEPLRLCLRGTKTPSLHSCKCKIPCLEDKEAVSLNHAYTLISTYFETKRISHAGNVFRLGYWRDTKTGKWIRLDELRLVREAERGAPDKSQGPS